MKRSTPRSDSYPSRTRRVGRRPRCFCEVDRSGKLASMKPFFGLLLIPLLAIGCAPRLTFDVSVTNETRDPITLGIIKTAPPYEPDFAGPEHFAINSPQSPAPPWGHVVPPGRTIDSPPVTGSFPDDAHAYLRVYRAEHSN